MPNKISAISVVYSDFLDDRERSRIGKWRSVGEAHSQQFALARPAKDHRDFPLVPDIGKLLRVHTLTQLPHPIDPISATEPWSDWRDNEIFGRHSIGDQPALLAESLLHVDHILDREIHTDV
jgi:hypothetical protein